MTTLIISPDIKWSINTQQLFLVQGLQCEVAHTGKEAQLKAYQKKFIYFVLDLDVQDHSGMEVCTYLRKNFPQSKLMLSISTTKRMEELLKDEKKLTKMGITQLRFQPTPESVLADIQSLGRIPTWKNAQATSPSTVPDKDESIKDDVFSRIKITDLFENAHAAFDYYLRLGADRFIKIIHMGERPSREQLDKYSASGTIYLYFMQKDRPVFISSQNDLAQDMLNKSPQNSGKVIDAMTSNTDKFFEEIFIAGIQPRMIEEGKAICQNMYDAAVKDEGLKKFINDLEQFNPAALSHSFLVSFFSALICKDLDWVGTKTVQTLALGALFHDIGVLQLPPNIREMDLALMNPDQKKIYNSHPKLGADALKEIPGINAGVIQIVQQHHEYLDGSGFPLGLSGHKIYPLAKIVTLADDFSYFIKESEMSPIEGLKIFLQQKRNLTLYDPILIRNLIKALK
jgi:putative nucleotidyltransferase with HDIG domain